MTICACLIAACLLVWALVWVWQATINPPAKHREPYPKGGTAAMIGLPGSPALLPFSASPMAQELRLKQRGISLWQRKLVLL